MLSTWPGVRLNAMPLASSGTMFDGRRVAGDGCVGAMPWSRSVGAVEAVARVGDRVGRGRAATASAMPLAVERRADDRGVIRLDREDAGGRLEDRSCW